MAAEVVKVALSSRITMVISSMLICLSGFHTLVKLVKTVKRGSFWILLLFSGVNAMIALVVETSSNGPVSPLAMAMIPAVMILELALITNDSWWGYVNFYFALLMDLVCVQGICGAILNLMLHNVFTVGSLQHQYALFNLTMIIGALLFWKVTHFRSYSNSELSELMHSRSRGMVLFVYFLLGSIVLLLSSFFTLELIYRDTLLPRDRFLVHFNLALKDGLILVCSFLIIIIQIRQDRNLQRSLSLDKDLQKERNFRVSSQKTAMLTYCANITQNRLEEGEEYFSPGIRRDEEGYLETLKQFALHCVLPEDQPRLFNIGNPNYFEEKLAADPSYDLRFRLSPARIMEVTELPLPVQEKLLQTKKEWIWVEFHVTITRDAETGDIRSYISLTDIDNVVESEDALRRAASIDPLTEIYNRAGIEKSVREYLLKNNAIGTLFMIDLDHFKEVNDTLGHPVGDRLLRETASMIKAVFRDADIVGRLGGDEFCVFAPGLSSEEVILQRVTELNERGWRVHATPDGQQIQTSLSIGVATAPDCGSSYDALYKSADTALYQAKAAGRNTFRICSPSAAGIL